MSQLKVLDKTEDIEALNEYLAEFEYITFDTETTGVHQGAEIIGMSMCAEETIAHYIILAKWSKELNKLVYVHYHQDAIFNFFNTLKTKNLIMHNGVFDCAMVEANFKISLIESLHTDTMILSHLLNENRRHGLKELGVSEFGQDAKKEQEDMQKSVLENGGLLTKDKYELYKADAYKLGLYGAKDALLTYQLFLKFVPELYEQKLDAFFYDEECMPLLKGSTYDLNTTGINVDGNKLTSLKNTLIAECAEAKHFILTEIATHVKDKYPGDKKKNTFNIGSAQQLSWLLFGKLELEFGSLTDGGRSIAKELGLKTYTFSEKRNFIAHCSRNVGHPYKPGYTVPYSGEVIKPKLLKEPWGYIKVDKKTLQKLAPKFKWIERLLEYQSKKKLLNTYVEGIEERVQYGVVHASFLQHGTTSGRYASRNPNLQNLPRDDKRIKECFVSRPGKVFVGADYSQLEPRVFAYMSQDKRLMEAFDGTSDFYSVVGMNVFNKTDCTPQKDGHPDAFGVKYKKLRNNAKVISLASVYGATAHQLAPATGKSKEDTQLDIDNYFEEFPDVAKMMLESHEIAKKQGYVTNLFGRPRRMPEALKITKIYGKTPHAELPYEVRNVLNLAVNHRIQSTGASIVNRAAIAFNSNCKIAGIECKLVAQIHDELIAECYIEDAEEVFALLQDAMENTTTLPGVKLEAIPRITTNLAK